LAAAAQPKSGGSIIKRHLGGAGSACNTVAVELWDDQTRNLIDDFEDEAEALALIRRVIVERGRDAVAAWALDRLDSNESMIRGEELVRLAMATL
jgi:hypothetical protein